MENGQYDKAVDLLAIGKKVRNPGSFSVLNFWNLFYNIVPIHMDVYIDLYFLTNIKILWIKKQNFQKLQFNFHEPFCHGNVTDKKFQLQYKL